MNHLRAQKTITVVSHSTEIYNLKQKWKQYRDRYNKSLSPVYSVNPYVWRRVTGQDKAVNTEDCSSFK